MHGFLSLYHRWLWCEKFFGFKINLLFGKVAFNQSRMQLWEGKNNIRSVASSDLVRAKKKKHSAFTEYLENGILYFQIFSVLCSVCDGRLLLVSLKWFGIKRKSKCNWLITGTQPNYCFLCIFQLPFSLFHYQISFEMFRYPKMTAVM